MTAIQNQTIKKNHFRSLLLMHFTEQSGWTASLHRERSRQNGFDAAAGQQLSDSGVRTRLALPARPLCRGATMQRTAAGAHGQHGAAERGQAAGPGHGERTAVRPARAETAGTTCSGAGGTYGSPRSLQQAAKKSCSPFTLPHRTVEWHGADCAGNTKRCHQLRGLWKLRPRCGHPRAAAAAEDTERKAHGGRRPLLQPRAPWSRRLPRQGR